MSGKLGIKPILQDLSIIKKKKTKTKQFLCMKQDNFQSLKSQNHGKIITESMNHDLKSQFGLKAQKMPDLINILYKELQYLQTLISMALHETDDFELSPDVQSQPPDEK